MTKEQLDLIEEIINDVWREVVTYHELHEKKCNALLEDVPEEIMIRLKYSQI